MAYKQNLRHIVTLQIMQQDVSILAYPPFKSKYYSTPAGAAFAFRPLPWYTK